MGDRAANCALGRVKEGIDMRIYLRNDRECHPKVKIQGFQWNIGPQAEIALVSRLNERKLSTYLPSFHL